MNRSMNSEMLEGYMDEFVSIDPPGLGYENLQQIEDDNINAEYEFESDEKTPEFLLEFYENENGNYLETNEYEDINSETNEDEFEFEDNGSEDFLLEYYDNEEPENANDSDEYEFETDDYSDNVTGTAHTELEHSHISECTECGKRNAEQELLVSNPLGEFEQAGNSMMADELYAIQTELETSLDKLKNIFQTVKNVVSSPILPTHGADGKALKIPIISIPLPASSHYTIRSESRKYGIPETIEALKWIGKSFYDRHPQVEVRIGDISQLGGGKISGHASHRMGIDVDVSLYINGGQINSSFKNYAANQMYVKDYIRTAFENPFLKIHIIGFLDKELKDIFKGTVNLGLWKGHANHLHLRFCIPENRISKADIKKVYGNDPVGTQQICRSGEVNIVSNFNIAVSTINDERIDINAAIQYNRTKRDAVGWGKYISLVNLILGFPLQNPSDADFAKSVAKWQRLNKLKDIDGKLGPNTWKAMFPKLSGSPTLIGRWNNAAWDASARKAIEVHGPDLLATVPSDIQVFCPRYSQFTRNERVNFWIYLISCMAEKESGFKTNTQYVEKFGVTSRGLLQLSIDSAKQSRYGNVELNNAMDLHKPELNILAGVRILNFWVKADKRIGGYKLGGGRYWSVLRPTSKSFLKIVNYMNAYCKA